MSYIEKLESLIHDATVNRRIAEGDDARYWAIVITDLEKVLAFVSKFLVKESE